MTTGKDKLIFNLRLKEQLSIDDCAKDGGEDFFTKMHCIL